MEMPFERGMGHNLPDSRFCCLLLLNGRRDAPESYSIETTHRSYGARVPSNRAMAFFNRSALLLSVLLLALWKLHNAVLRFRLHRPIWENAPTDISRSAVDRWAVRFRAFESLYSNPRPELPPLLHHRPCDGHASLEPPAQGIRAIYRTVGLRVGRVNSAENSQPSISSFCSRIFSFEARGVIPRSSSYMHRKPSIF